jgi:hypothetical protein
MGWLDLRWLEAWVVGDAEAVALRGRVVGVWLRRFLR